MGPWALIVAGWVLFGPGCEFKARDMHDFVHKGEGVSEQGQGILPGETYCCYTEFWPSAPCTLPTATTTTTATVPTATSQALKQIPQFASHNVEL